MCRTSVDPMPSRISVPKRDFQRLNSSPGSGSPAETQRRREERSCGTSFCASIAAYSVGTPKKTVGFESWMARYIRSGVGRSGTRTALAPTQKGKARPFPSP